MVPAALSVALRRGPDWAPGPAACVATRGVKGWIGNRGLWSLANPGVHPNSGKSPPQPTIRYCWTIEKTVVVIQ